MTKIVLNDKQGGAICELPETAEEVVVNAEEDARRTGTTKRRSLFAAFKSSVKTAGYDITDSDMQTALKAVDQLRSGKAVPSIRFTVHGRIPEGSAASPKTANTQIRNERPTMSQSNNTTGLRFFENEQLYPNDNAATWFGRLVGIEDQKQTMLLELELLLKPELVEQWSKEHHQSILPACEIMSSRAPLLVLEGDVGCGKTVLAESIGDPLAKRLGCHVHLMKINTQVRGSGMVGEMTDLIAKAFTAIEDKARRNSGEPVLLLIDEADSLASKRAEQHMHHEDKAGVNTLLQRIDRLRRENLPVAVIFITNRPEALDSAVRRRAAVSIRFERPNAEVRAELFHRNFPDLALSGAKLEKLVSATGESGNGHERFTASDITDRLIPAAIKMSYLSKTAVTADTLIEAAQAMKPTPRIEDI
ncbi:ATP-binding protein [Aureliella helgolandensis]|uniref:Proteasome-associated ATPase n=1 Tax=Aureliella helgolandensis TaxID=2527968 RepID=A0A518GBU2_9BACT|nr:ATP-binding protein [Aureliella helgolandensis]QDV26058.1 Proteasome-associated ATPase [Aureliella helgolandensis]